MSILKRDKPKDAERHIVSGSGGAAADAAADGRHKKEDYQPNSPASRPAKALGENEKHDQLAEKEKHAEDRQEALIDESLEESFPSSDPPSAKRIT